MPTLPLYDAASVADASHRVTAPGGYEWWYFDAEDPAADVQVVAILFEGFVFHPGYLRRYAAYVRNPTRRTPPAPGDYPCAYFAVYEKGALLAQFLTQVKPGEFAASSEATDVTVGPNRLRREDGVLRLGLRGRPWRVTWRGPKTVPGTELSADLTFRPRFAHGPRERTFFSRELSGADHRWVIADPLCDVSGDVRFGGRTIAFRGRGYHDHNYGSGPVGPGLRRWVWGRVLGEDRATTFHVVTPRDGSRPSEVHVVETDAEGVRDGEAEMVSLEGSRYTRLGLAYPAMIRLPQMTFSRPRVVDGSPFYLRLLYTPEEGAGPPAFCEVAYPHRLRWPVLGRMIEMSIDRPR